MISIFCVCNILPAIIIVIKKVIMKQNKVIQRARCIVCVYGVGGWGGGASVHMHVHARVYIILYVVSEYESL